MSGGGTHPGDNVSKSLPHHRITGNPEVFFESGWTAKLRQRCPEVLFEEITIDLLEARFGPSSGLLTIRKLARLLTPRACKIVALDWQVESGLRTAVFLSATSSDLGECRRRTSNILLEAGILPVAQDYFGPDPRTIEGLLLDKIMAADAVVCLVGLAFGAAPIVDGKVSGRSYTQMEYDFAVRYEKRIYIFVATDEFGHANPVDEPEDLRNSQAAHRKTILTGSTKYQLFSTNAELEGQIRSLVRPILAASRRRSIRYIHVPPAPVCFVGRTDETIQLRNAFEMRMPAVIVLLGMGGQGKTTLLAHALRERKTLPFAAGVWVSAERGDFTFSDFLDCALGAFMEHRFNKLEMSRLDTRIRQLVSLLQARPLLVVIDAIERWLTGWVEDRKIDGLHDLSLRAGVYEGLDDFLASASALESGSHVILTSRALPAALDTLSCTILPVFTKGRLASGLGALPPEAAIELLEKLGMVAPKEKLRNLAESLVCHPLALTGFARVARRLGSGWESVLAGVGSDPTKRFHSLVDEIRKHLPNRQHSEAILGYASLLPEGAPVGLLNWLLQSEREDTIDPVDEASLLAEVLTLADWSVLVWDAETHSVLLHALFAEYFSELIANQEKDSIHSRAASWYEASAVDPGDQGIKYGVLALRHTMAASDGERAFRIMFLRGLNDSPCLLERLVANGHLWECAELLATLQAIAPGLQKAQSMLARAQILNDLELSQRALADVRVATELILAQADTGWLPVQALLAKCNGIEGVLHIESGRATDALQCLNRAVSLFETLIVQTRSYHVDLAKTLANRGIAKWATGDWDGADDDFKRTLSLLCAPNQECVAEDLMMVHEIRARLAAINLDRGNVGSAVQTLEIEVGELRKSLGQSQHLPTKNYLVAEMSLVVAYIAAGRFDRALTLVRELRLPLEEKSRQGRWEFNSVLAQARVYEARALLQLGNAAEADHACQDAIGLYEDLIKKGATKFEGQLGNALFRRAEARIRLGNETGSRADLQRALASSKTWIHQWYGECDIQTVFIENALGMLPILPEGFVPEKRQILEILRGCVERLLPATTPSAAALREEQMLREKWQMLQTVAAAIDAQGNDQFPTTLRGNSGTIGQ
jgi:hypothetical protein